MSLIEGVVAQSFIEVLEDNGDWMTRNDIAKAAGIKRFTTYYGNVLDALVENQLIQRETRTRGQYQTYYAYRARKVNHGKTP